MQLPAESLQTLVKVSGGDLRKAITTLQSAVRLQVSGGTPACIGMIWREVGATLGPRMLAGTQSHVSINNRPKTGVWAVSLH